MKLVHSAITVKDAAGAICIVPEEAEDMYVLYNILAEGDLVKTSTLRKVVKESASKEKQIKTVKVVLTVMVEKIEFDTQVCALRLSGRNQDGNAHVQAGVYHTLVVEQGRKLAITKDCWDHIYLSQIKESCSPEAKAEVAAICMMDTGAQIFLVTGSMTITKGKIEKKMHKNKARRPNKNDKAEEKFFTRIYELFTLRVSLDKVKAIILGGPRELTEKWLSWALARAARNGDQALIKAGRSPFLVVPLANSSKFALEEALNLEQVQKRLGDTKAAVAVKSLDKWKRLVNSDNPALSGKASFGYGHVFRADEATAVELLLVTDALFRCRELKTRRQYVDLVESVRDHGGVAHVLSAAHASGEQLTTLAGGVAAVLRFPLVDELEIENDNKARAEAKKRLEELDIACSDLSLEATSVNSSSSSAAAATATAAKPESKEPKVGGGRRRRRKGKGGGGGGGQAVATPKPVPTKAPPPEPQASAPYDDYDDEQYYDAYDDYGDDHGW